MTKAIFLSKNGAAEVRMFLDSVGEFANKIFDISVIYTVTDEGFLNGYKKLKKEYPYINYFLYTGDDLKEYLVDMLKVHKGDNVVFFTDGDIFYQKIAEEDIDKALEDEEVFCFSFRLGNNVTYCHNTKSDNKTHDVREEDGFIKWNWSKHYLDFGYPLTVHGHVFRGADIYKLVKKSVFKTPFELEESLQQFEYFPREYMKAYSHAAMTTLLAGEDMLKMILNAKYMKGEPIDRSKIEFDKSNACFMSHRFNFKKEKV